MTGTNITVLDNFFYNIEKNIFSTIVLKSQKGLWKKGAEESAEGSTGHVLHTGLGAGKVYTERLVLLSLAHAQNAQTAVRRRDSVLFYLTRLIEKVN